VGSDVRYDQGAVPGVTVELTGNPNRQFCVDVLGTNRWQLFKCCFTASNTNTSITFSAIKKVTGYYVGLDDVIVLPASSIAKSSNAKLP
jgi:hypothetical protein